MSRVVNNVVFGAALYGACTSFAGPAGIISQVALVLAARKIASTFIGYSVYPAALRSLSGSGAESLKQTGDEQMQSLREEGYVVKKISIYKSGTKYDAAIIGHSTTIDNGKWTIRALGNGMAMEDFVSHLAKENFGHKSNTLLVNGPSVGSSGGWPTRYQLGAGFEAGLQLLEREIGATQIVMHGLSLGGGMMAEAILNHDFTEGMNRDIRYLSISDRTFSRLSSIAAHVVGAFVKPLFFVSGTELDGLGAAKKLSELGIRQVIIQHNSLNADGSDWVIPDSKSLAYKLHAEKGLQNKVFLESPGIDHNGPLPFDIQASLSKEINSFFQN